MSVQPHDRARSYTPHPSRPAFSCAVVHSTEPIDVNAWVSRYVAHVVALHEAIQRKEAA
jgi:hypothetical protein